MTIFPGYIGKYHKTLETLIKHFAMLMGYLTLDINLDNDPDIKIPIKFTAASKIYEAYMANKDKIRSLLPLITYQLVNINYFADLHTNSILGRRKYERDNNTVEGAPDGTEFMYLNAPYRVTIKMNIMSSKLANVYQILEQILPAFTPTLMKCNIEELQKYEPCFDKYNFTINSVQLIQSGTQLYPSYLEDLHIVEILFTVDIILFSKILRNIPDHLIREILIEYYAENILDLRQYINEEGIIINE